MQEALTPGGGSEGKKTLSYFHIIFVDCYTYFTHVLRGTEIWAVSAGMDSGGMAKRNQQVDGYLCELGVHRR
jgi:hypothetical protein